MGQVYRILYVLDEPSIGLHQKDNIKLIETLKNLRDLGNTVIVVEHDEEAMLASDYIVDIGEGAGINGGNIIAEGTSTNLKILKVLQEIIYLEEIKYLLLLIEEIRKMNT